MQPDVSTRRHCRNVPCESQGLLDKRRLLPLGGVRVRLGGSQPREVCQSGNVKVGGKRIQVERPRLRSKDGKEVKVPAYEILKEDPKSGQRALVRWCASALVLAEQNFRSIKGVKDLWMLKSALDNQLEIASN